MKYKLYIVFLLLIVFSCKKENEINVDNNKPVDTLHFFGNNSVYAYITTGIVAQLNADTGYVKYKWSTGDTTPSIIVSKSGTYTCELIGQSSNSFIVICKDFAEEIPTAFTPNGDGINDLFYIPFYDLFPNIYFAITDYNRNIVFVSKAPELQMWDGRDKNRNSMPDGTYYYYININPKKPNTQVYRGSVKLIRNF